MRRCENPRFLCRIKEGRSRDAFFGCGVSVPLLGFGAVLGKGVREAILKDGALGILTGGLTAGAAGISAALLSAFLAALFFRSRPKQM